MSVQELRELAGTGDLLTEMAEGTTAAVNEGVNGGVNGGVSGGGGECGGDGAGVRPAAAVVAAAQSQRLVT